MRVGWKGHRLWPWRALLALAAGMMLIAAVIAGELLLGSTGGTGGTAGTGADLGSDPGADVGPSPAETAVALPPATGRAAATPQARIAALVNAERVKAGCPRLALDEQLQTAALAHADDMAARGYYEHVGPEGSDAGDRMKAVGYDWNRWAENLHRGPDDPTAVVADWMRSPEHRANLLNCRFTDMGVGVNFRPDGPWWVQALAAPKSAR
ncbi:CAP domain-containing protein [Streptomyces sp. NPDC096176]|uniref:CAP domain-containing protein n=1 Tax=Streptomyces sp. NPDC096176 TaxID=3366079 RepID=UPI003825EA16